MSIESSRMSSLELRAGLGLAGIYALRMLGIFLFLPVFMPYASHLPGSDPALGGMAFGIFALVQACLLIPFGMWSDRVGRKRVIYIGLALLAIGSFIAGSATDIYTLIAARALQGTGAISAALTALLADLTREEHRTKAMAMIGGSIGVTFAVSLVVAAKIEHWIGVPGMFRLIGCLAIAAALGVKFVVPDPVISRFHSDAETKANRLPDILRNPDLLRLNFGVFALHAAQAAMFAVIPFVLTKVLQLDKSVQWHIYLPVAALGFVLMVPAIIYGEKKGKLKPVFLGAIILMLIAQAGMAFGLVSFTNIFALLAIYFVAFNVLEATLPSLISKMAPADAKGTAMGVQNTAQSIGFAVGGGLGGVIYKHQGTMPTFLFCAFLMLVWFVIGLGMRPPMKVSSKMFHLGDDWRGDANALRQKLAACDGVLEVAVIPEESAAYLKVAQAGWDEMAVKQLIDSTL
ncbi:MFS transporter [Leeia oryzae]|uniref:MFS transporter n=1 Tax=Leeia oryzae TaxID=356662 RepID=UPI000364B988|nr:MFS transporter [Leeia oryzae]